MPCSLLNFCEYETNKLVRIKSIPIGSLKWSINGLILGFICIMLFWNKEYQEYDQVVSSVTAKVKGVAVTNITDVGEILWDAADYSGLSQGKNSFFVMTNAIVTNKQRQGKCAEVPGSGKICYRDQDCTKGYSDQHSHGVQTGSCVKYDTTRKTCQVVAWCPIESKNKPPKPALLESAENFTVLIKNNIRFPAFNYIKRNILPHMNDTYLKSCMFSRRMDPLCPILRLGDIVQEARENFSQMAVEGGVIGIQINWHCNLDRFFHKCLPEYSFRRLDEKESNKTLYPGLNFRFARYNMNNGIEERMLFKAFGIRFDVMVFGKAGRFSIIQLVIYIGSTLSYYALTTVFIDWFITTYLYPRCCARATKNNYSEKKYETVEELNQIPLCISFVDEDQIIVVKRPLKKSLQETKPSSSQHRKPEHSFGRTRVLVNLLQSPSRNADTEIQEMQPPKGRGRSAPAWCQCGRCQPMPTPQEQLCCRRSKGQCITTSPAFPRLVLDRHTLESALLYREPLLELPQARCHGHLRHCAYSLYIEWRFGRIQTGTFAAVPSCSVWRIRDEYPSEDGRYSGLCYENMVIISSNG
uniref:P2X purinoceptor n=1 Tax=Lepisosteus oculatus TaxID=7918 RepID=W5MJ17_LEPOC